ncbi:MAG: DNA polymerase IV [Oscillospiraceae bacterium]|nr:DNA polymerase IV [Oscillospiraceae bacterium]
MERVILHCDLNSFFASVELLSHPELINLPVAVCGDPSSRHGIILAKNEHAKRFGVKTAETLWQAKQKCPSLVLLPPHHSLYEVYSRRVNDIYGHYTDLVEPFGIDESWLDLTGSLHLFGGDPRAVADEIRHRVYRELGLTISVGVSFNKVFAKLGSDYKKPDATTVISPADWRQIVWPLPVGDLLFVGRAAQTLLRRCGVETIGQLAAFDRARLVELMGKLGGQLHDYANGLDRSEVRRQDQHETVKSVGNGTTFPKNLTRPEEIRAGLALLSDSVASRLRRQGLYCGGVSVTLRSADFKTFSRQKRLDAPTRLMRDIYRAAVDLAMAAWHAPEPLRMLTVTALYITEQNDAYEQVDLLGGAAEKKSDKQERLEGAMAAIRGKYGKGAISFGAADGEKVGWED